MGSAQALRPRLNIWVGSILKDDLPVNEEIFEIGGHLPPLQPPINKAQREDNLSTSSLRLKILLIYICLGLYLR